MTSPFEFAHGEYPQAGDEYVIHIPADLASKEVLLALLREKLRFPAYCGSNWDALLDCLRDLAWLQPRRIVLVHEDVPRLQPDDLRNYIGVLRSAAEDWSLGDDHELHIVFPDWKREAVLSWLKDK